MIVGIGVDLCKISRIAQATAMFGDRFAQKILTNAERTASDLSVERAALLAGSFAAKEACAKALGVGIETRIRWHEIEVLGSKSRKPSIRLSGNAQLCAAELTPPDHELTLHLTLTHTSAIAQALVVLEAIGRGGRG